MHFLRRGVATTHRGNILKNDEAEDFYEPQALSGIRGLLAVMPDRGYEDGSTSPDGNAGGGDDDDDDDDDTGWRCYPGVEVGSEMCLSTFRCLSHQNPQPANGV
ncbi:hypothetical protein N7455_009616 [Penicillium solitum]|uniref:uncharacterized protein n=1 Tax=Penicillium solitum TaxID=60172 RepID=UPI0032C475C7|nr:hypothetical protein N7455_009616 [Penicillium solitum]